MKKKTLDSHTFNFGIAFLKVFLAFDVIRSHNFKINSTKNKILKFIMRNRRIHVPSFFIISFFFIQKELISLNINRFIKRIERLIIPYFIWPIIIWILNNIINKIYYSKFASSFRALKYQLLWGTNFLGQLWFQWDLIVITTIFFILIYIFKKNYLSIFQIVNFLAYFLQYSGINKKIYMYFSREKREVLGRFTEVIPYAVSGFSLASLEIIKNIQQFKIKTLIFALLFYILIEKYNIFSNLDGIAYPGIKLNLK